MTMDAPGPQFLRPANEALLLKRAMKYRLRSLMIVVTLAAICVAWWTDHRRLAQENRQLQDRVRQEHSVSALPSVAASRHSPGIRHIRTRSLGNTSWMAPRIQSANVHRPVSAERIRSAILMGRR